MRSKKRIRVCRDHKSRSCTDVDDFDVVVPELIAPDGGVGYSRCTDGFDVLRVDGLLECLSMPTDRKIRKNEYIVREVINHGVL